MSEGRNAPLDDLDERHDVDVYGTLIS